MTTTQTQLKYIQVKNQLDEIINRLDVGDKLPSERNLAVDLECSFLTVRKALQLLMEEGRIIKKLGSGSFVAPAQGPQKHDQIGLLLHAHGDAYSLRLAGMLTKQASHTQMHLITKLVDNFDKPIDQVVQSLEEQGCGSIIVPWLPWEQSDALCQLVKRSSIPFCLPLLLPGLEECCFERPTIFGQTSQQCVETAGTYFQELGYKHIAFLGPSSSDNSILHRKITGYTNFICRSETSPMHLHLVKDDGLAMDNLVKEISQMCPDLAIISYDDTHAIRLITAMHKLGLKAPDDFAIVGYNDTEAACHSDPPLSSFHNHFDYAAKQLLKHARALAQDKSAQSSKSPPLYLRVRQTCSGLKRLPNDLPDSLKRLDILDSSSL